MLKRDPSCSQNHQDAPNCDYTESGILQDVPASSRLLRYSAAPELVNGGVVEAQADSDALKKRRVVKEHQFQGAFGLPWTWNAFVKKAVESQHPFLK